MYEPEVNDYVIWERPNGDTDEGWVYHKGDPVDNEKRIKSGWNPVSQYITIETSVRPKPNYYYSSGKEMKHKMIHTLLICNRENWNELSLLKREQIKSVNIILNMMMFMVMKIVYQCISHKDTDIKTFNKLNTRHSMINVSSSDTLLYKK